MLNRILIFTLLMLTCSCAASVYTNHLEIMDEESAISSEKIDRGNVRTATSSFKVERDKDGNRLITTVNRRFSLADWFIAPSSLETLLLLEEFKSERKLDNEGQNSSVKVSAWSGPNWSKTLWTFEESGDDGDIWNERFYRIIKHGCCASISTEFYFNLLTGQKVYSSTTGLFEIVVPSGGYSMSRYVAYHSTDGMIKPTGFQKDSDLIGVIQYGSEDKVISKLALRSKIATAVRIKFLYRDKIAETNSLMLVDVTGRQDKFALSDFSIVLSLGNGDDVILPVRNDNVDVSKAVVPDRYKLEAVK